MGPFFLQMRGLDKVTLDSEEKTLISRAGLGTRV
ncbi:hypothetical protein Theba_1514 [Mesotoga prima MesG1.Ag.4.2]|uniref:Uncharacterized protein n=1 Tax=Mesotoga prima MesG1.Ag.4.2 TaxID=660470 RepID=I2F5J3_9BACT|nr:hypothetical protein Theba_1514 [Mesotoga prima MesG1.Ag.4.2]